MASAAGTHVGPSVKRACDQCHARKVHCTGNHPCARCVNGSVLCTFLNPQKRKGPVPKRNAPGYQGEQVFNHGFDQAGTPLASALVHQPPSPSFNDVASRILAWQSRPPPEIPLTPIEVSPLLTVTLDNLVKPQIAVFITRIYPMMPVYKPHEVLTRLVDPGWMYNPEWVALLFAMTALSLVHPLEGAETAQRDVRSRQAMIFMDEAARLNGKWHLGVNPTVESVMASYCMFGALHEMGYASGARLRLREAISLGEAMGLDRAEGYNGLEVAEVQRRMRLFWILAVTERAYALQRNGPLVFDHPTAHGLLMQNEDSEALLLRHLSSVFSSVDRKLAACWNGKCPKATCRDLTLEQAVSVLRRLHGSVEDVFGQGETLAALNEPQKADLLITWQWMRSRVWDLAASHGLTSEDAEFEASTKYVADIARTVVGICSRLSQSAMEHHGKGFAEKLFDIASLAARHVQVSLDEPHDSITPVRMLITFVSRHPASNFDSAFILETMLQNSIDASRILDVP